MLSFYVGRKRKLIEKSVVDQCNFVVSCQFYNTPKVHYNRDIFFFGGFFFPLHCIRKHTLRGEFYNQVLSSEEWAWSNTVDDFKATVVEDIAFHLNCK